MDTKPVDADPWQALRQFTAARIALGRAGVSLPTAPQLAFQLAYAQARDAVHQALDTAALSTAFAKQGYACIALHSAAPDRTTYLQRPDLGRRLDAASRQVLESSHAARAGPQVDIAFVVVDGLSPLAITQNALPLLQLVRPELSRQGWTVAPVAIVEQGRVAIGDEIGESLGASMVVVLIGERPGLSSPDSMGLYLTWRPHVGLTDASRNCISNIRPTGLCYAHAAHKLLYLMTQARQRHLSGVLLKDETISADALSKLEASNFLLDAP